MSYLIYDCEIIKMIPSRDGMRLDGYEYCEGWTDYQGMGISVVGFYTSLYPESAAWCYSDFDCPLEKGGFADLVADHDHVIGFKSKNFDDKLMAANGVEVTTTYDLLEEVRIAAGFGPDYRSVPKGRSYSLDLIARANGMAKTGSGALAPQLWQDGKYQEVIDYCRQDVKITHDILKLGLAGKLVDPNTGRLLKLKPLD